MVLNPHPFEKTNIFSRLTFEFVTPLLFRGLKKVIKEEDVWDQPENHKATILKSRFDDAWPRNKSKKRALLITLHQLFGVRFWFAGVLLFISEALSLLSPLFVQRILRYLESNDGTLNPFLQGHVYILVMLAVMLLGVFCAQHSFHINGLVGIDIRSVLEAELYQKSLLLSNKAKQQRQVGEIVNLMSTDVQKVSRNVAMSIHWTWVGTFKLIACFVMLFTLVGWVSIVGVVIMVLVMPFQTLIFKYFFQLQMALLGVIDTRIRTITEVIQGMRIIKFFTWENAYIKKIADIRSMELKLMVKLQTLRALLGSLLYSSPIAVSVVTFGIYAIWHPLKADIIFPALGYFNLMRLPMTFLAMVFNAAVETSASISRLQSFMLDEEVVHCVEGNDASTPIKLVNCNFEWDALETPEQQNKEDLESEVSSPSEKKSAGKLHDLSFQVSQGSLTFIVGKVASGKSSLLQALIGEMKHYSGELEVTGKIAYCPQQAWIKNATLKDNILFGEKLDQAFYDQVLDMCCLRKDLEVLSAGDLTEIGEKGINLSGGQKQRVSLARAVYCNRDLYLLDDVLSALDSHVGREIFEKCIVGHLRGKTRVFVTHQLQYLQHATDIIVFDEGRIIEHGSYNDLMSKPSGHLSRLVAQHVSSETKVTSVDTKAVASTSEEVSSDAQQEQQDASSKFIQAEEINEGAVSIRVFWYYIQSIGGPVVLAIILALYFIAQLGATASDGFVALWTSNKLSSLSTPELLGIYAAIGVVGVILLFIREIVCLYASIYASYSMHKNATTRIVRAPASFFDTTPAGRIISRFSKDFQHVDFMIPTVVKGVLGDISLVVLSIGLMIYSAPLLLVALIPVTILYILIQELYRRTFRELNRLNNNLRSPLVAHFTETLYGLSTIRAYKQQPVFIRQTNKRIDDVERVSLSINSLQAWLDLRYHSLGAVLVTFTGFFIILTKGFVPTGVAALSLTYAFQLSQVIQLMLTTAVESEAAFNSVERVMHYCNNVEQEAPETIEEFRPSREWPQAGKITIDNLSLKYRSDLPYVLKNVSLSIAAGEKIGIVGRTGSGKSSLMLGLYRMADIIEGSITIDGEETMTMGTHDARKAITIIPQDPMLFSGTIRSNLDPFNQCSDRALWSALEKAHMKAAVEEMPAGLESPVTEGGENYSVGQRQLLCLARALTREKSKIIILDEATASVDFDTDALIQQTVRKEFKDRTLLTIAHRINTIVDADKILVLQQGSVAEFDTPKNLISNPQSEFHSLVRQTGEANAAKIFQAIMTHNSSKEQAQ